MQGIEHWFGAVLPDLLALNCVHVFDFALNLINTGKLLQCETGDLAFARGV
jgi:hypothetical protein